MGIDDFYILVIKKIVLQQIIQMAQVRTESISFWDKVSEISLPH